MAPHYDDPQQLDGFREAVRDTAYFLWEQAGKPEGRSDEFWYKALAIHYRERAYGIWRRQLKNQKPDTADDPEPIGNVSGTDLSEDETLQVAEGIEHERDA
ncbi:DUF2934 domain-containing protein [Devosia nitrariae]|uniref:DUF2934 domain-containing protein n=1 Tax=Devosia nitrariae TaxID=2071872 RepID=A0ABQ5W6U8_9HYPH|nr:DUF2934 domain-containing protein [Devosia nitrariae]GLQ55508.1 hypothetical protein GCM10010862_27670 [Devosia nitrariae]